MANGQNNLKEPARGPAQSRLIASVLGMKIRTPLIVASGPITDGGERIRRAFNAGAGAVVSKTIYCEEQPKILERTALFGTGMLNTTLYSRRPLDVWRSELRRLKGEGIAVIPNLHASTPDKLGALAAQIAEIGFPVIELGISCPHDSGHMRAAPSKLAQYVASARRRVGTAITVKLSASDGIYSQAEAAIGEGADALSVSDTLPGVLVDTERWQLTCSGVAGYSGPGIKPIVLNAIYNLRSSGISCPIIGIGGVETAEDVLQYLYVGACAVQAYTIFNGSRFTKISKINNDLDRWLVTKNTSIERLVSGNES
ncbi:MAG: hypothetical protein JO328_09525 [Hyphomicrobiales bacterium]|nr:hypothetical protein [Hyphomicrobiales bacterium]MBV8824398.1 hypothetical protein [Hyphomicrobiales bacterium]